MQRRSLLDNCDLPLGLALITIPAPAGHVVGKTDGAWTEMTDTEPIKQARKQTCERTAQPSFRLPMT